MQTKQALIIMSEPTNDKEDNNEIVMASFDSPAVGGAKSPPGMVLRTGKKKRRRSKETTGLTPEDEVKVKRSKKTPAKSTSSSPRKSPRRDEAAEALGADDDENMESEESGEEEEDDEDMPEEETTGETTAESTPVVAAKQQPDDETKQSSVAIQGLRLPSQKTPATGREKKQTAVVDTPYDKRYIGRLAPEDLDTATTPTTGTPGADEADEEEEQVVVEQQQKATPVVDVAAAAGIESIMIDEQPETPTAETPVKKLFRVITEMVAPQAVELEGADDDDSAQSTSVLRSPCFWFLVVFGLQIMFFQFAINPVYTVMMQVSDQSVLFYKEMVGVTPEVITKYETVTVPMPVPPTIKKPPPKVEAQSIDEHPQVMEQLEELQKTKKDFQEKQASLDDLATKTEEQLSKAKESLDERRQGLESLDQVLKEAEAELTVLVETPPNEMKQAIEESNVKETLDKVKEAIPKDAAAVDLEILDLDKVPMWEVVSEKDGCPTPAAVLPADGDELLTEDKLKETVTEVQMQAATVVKEIKEDPELKETVKEWIDTQVEDLEEEQQQPSEIDVGGVGDAEVSVDDGFSEQEAEKIIEEHLDIDRADKYGVLDVAAIYNGGEIIRKGPRATSPSLTESLPLVNRLMAKTKLRFYGHGPKAAISPQSDEKGQCWSFENTAKSKNPRWSRSFSNDGTNGKYATLSVRLAKPIYVSRVVVDHPPMKVPNEPYSALKTFRIYGYEDAHAKGKPLELGIFHYDAKSPSKEFELREIPQQVQSVTLAIDSTHNEDFSCLYRFRVLEGY